MVALLDVNVLIALFDRRHTMSEKVGEWFAVNASAGWSTCAITQNGFVRIIAQPMYPHALKPFQALALLKKACAQPTHEFWTCDVAITDSSVDAHRVLVSSQVTDVYLLALAVARGGQLVTLDHRIDTHAVAGATDSSLIVL